MRLIELHDFARGKYIGLKLTSDTIANLQKYCNTNGITGYPNEFHITLVKSKVDFPWEVNKGLTLPHIIKPKYNLVRVQAGSTLLVLQFNDQILKERALLAQELGASVSKKARLHLTLSYKFRKKDTWILQPPDFPLIVETEYVTPLLDPVSARKMLGIG